MIRYRSVFVVCFVFIAGNAMGQQVASAPSPATSAAQHPAAAPSGRPISVVAAKLSAGLDCDAVDTAMLAAQLQSINDNKPIPEGLQVSDLQCRTIRSNAAHPGDPPQIPVFVQMPPATDGQTSNRVMFGLLPRSAVVAAGAGCHGLVHVAPLALDYAVPGSGDVLGQVLSVTGDADCDTVMRGMLKSNPMVILSVSTVISSAQLDRAATMVGNIPGLKAPADWVIKQNDALQSSLATQSKTAVDWVIQHPQAAFVALNQLAAQQKLAEVVVKEMSKNLTVTLNAGRVASGDIVTAANHVGGAIGKTATDTLAVLNPIQNHEHDHPDPCILVPASCLYKRGVIKILHGI